MNATFVDTNFQRLLIKCEELAEKQELDNWRFEKVYKPKIRRKKNIKTSSNVFYLLVCVLFGRNAQEIDTINHKVNINYQLNIIKLD